MDGRRSFEGLLILLGTRYYNNVATTSKLGHYVAGDFRCNFDASASKIMVNILFDVAETFHWGRKLSRNFN